MWSSFGDDIDRWIDVKSTLKLQTHADFAANLSDRYVSELLILSV